MKNNKLLIILILSMVITSSFSMISFSDSINDKVSIDFDKALELAIQNSYKLETIDNKILISTRKLNSLNAKADAITNINDSNDSVYLENGKTKELYPEQEKRILNDLKDDKSDLLKDIRLDIISAYTNLKNKLSKIDTLQADYNTSITIYEQNKNKFKIGNITENELKAFESEVDQNLLKLKKAKLDIKLAEMELAKLTGYPLNTEFYLKGYFDLSVDIKKYDVEELANSAREKSKNVKKAIMDLKLKELEKKVVDKYTRYKRIEGYEDLEKTIEDLKSDLEDAKMSEELKLRSDYNTILNNEATVKINQLRHDLAKRNYETAKIKYKYGLITYIDYTKTIDEIRSTLDTLNDSKLVLYKSVDNFENYISYFNK